MHPSLLSRTFAADTGLRLSSVIKKRQVEEAKHLLRTTTWNTRMIASRAGFGTINTLFRVFRKYVGMTPQEYRRTVSSIGQKAADD
jgi:two-component system response regulator YesN